MTPIADGGLDSDKGNLMKKHIRKFCAPLAAATLLLASASAWARGPAVNVEFGECVADCPAQVLGPIAVTSVTIKGPRGKKCDASGATITVLRLLDSDSTAIAQAAVSGSLFATVTIDIARAQFWLADAKVASWSVNGDGDGPPSETVILSAGATSPQQAPNCD